MSERYEIEFTEYPWNEPDSYKLIGFPLKQLDEEVGSWLNELIQKWRIEEIECKIYNEWKRFEPQRWNSSYRNGYYHLYIQVTDVNSIDITLKANELLTWYTNGIGEAITHSYMMDDVELGKISTIIFHVSENKNIFGYVKDFLAMIFTTKRPEKQQKEYDFK